MLLHHHRAMSMAKNTGAFTLMELLVVIAIIVIVVALLFPALTLAREKGRQAVCLSNAKQIAVASMLYAGDHHENMCGERMGVGTGIGWPPPPKPNSGLVWTWRFALLPYTTGSSSNNTVRLWTCPTMPPTWDASLEEVDNEVKSSYGIAEDTFWGTYSLVGVHFVPVSSIRRPAQMILMGDSRWPGPGITARFLNWDYAWMGFWHTRRCDYAFWDGHVQALRPIATVRVNEGDCMWGHLIWPHTVHLNARNNARPEYR